MSPEGCGGDGQGHVFEVFGNNNEGEEDRGAARGVARGGARGGEKEDFQPCCPSDTVSMLVATETCSKTVQGSENTTGRKAKPSPEQATFVLADQHDRHEQQSREENHYCIERDQERSFRSHDDGERRGGAVLVKVMVMVERRKESEQRQKCNLLYTQTIRELVVMTTTLPMSWRQCRCNYDAHRPYVPSIIIANDLVSLLASYLTYPN
jgi:hypothetical protein